MRTRWCQLCLRTVQLTGVPARNRMPARRQRTGAWQTTASGRGGRQRIPPLRRDSPLAYSLMSAWISVPVSSLFTLPGAGSGGLLRVCRQLCASSGAVARLSASRLGPLLTRKVDGEWSKGAGSARCPRAKWVGSNTRRGSVSPQSSGILEVVVCLQKALVEWAHDEKRERSTTVTSCWKRGRNRVQSPFGRCVSVAPRPAFRCPHKLHHSE